jgi:hypothetical protein
MRLFLFIFASLQQNVQMCILPVSKEVRKIRLFFRWVLVPSSTIGTVHFRKAQQKHCSNKLMLGCACFGAHFFLCNKHVQMWILPVSKEVREIRLVFRWALVPSSTIGTVHFRKAQQKHCSNKLMLGCACFGAQQDFIFLWCLFFQNW